MNNKRLTIIIENGFNSMPLIYLLLIVITIFSCKSSHKLDIEKYESILLLEKFKDANLVIRKKATLESINNLKSRQILNIYISSSITNDTFVGRLAYECLKSRGMKDEYFQYFDTKNNVNFSKFIVSLNSVNKLEPDFKIDTDLKQLVYEIHDRDQRHRFNEDHDSIVAGDKKNKILLLEIFEKYGLPDESIIGVEFNKYGIVSNPLYVVILHLAQQGDQEILKKILELKLHNQVDEYFFSRMYSYGNTFNVPGYSGFIYCGNSDPLMEFEGIIKSFKCDSLSMADVDKIRSQFQMDKLDLMLKKLVFRHKYGFLFYEPYTYLSKIITDDHKTLEYYRENLIPIH